MKQLGQHCLKGKEQSGFVPNQFLKQILLNTLPCIISATTKNFELIQGAGSIGSAMQKSKINPTQFLAGCKTQALTQ